MLPDFKTNNKTNKVKIDLWRNNEGSPGDHDKESRREVVDNEILGIVTADLDIEASEREIAQFSIVIQEQTRIHFNKKEKLKVFPYLVLLSANEES